jgi:hypothetical protein
MVTEAERELITAAVDGELSADRQAAFHRLLAESVAALGLYQLLCRDRERLRDLPRAAAPPALGDRVMGRVRGAGRPVVPSRRADPFWRPAWVPLGVAASLLLIVGGASFTYFQSRAFSARTSEQVHALPKVPPHLESTPDPGPVALSPVPAPNREVTPLPRSAAREVARNLPPTARTPVEVAPTPRASRITDVLTSPVGSEAAPFSAVQVRLPLLLPLADLDGEDGRRRIAGELVGDPAFRIDLFVSDPNRAADGLMAAAKRSGVSLGIDAVAHERLKKRLPFGWAVVTDALTPAEIAGWLAAARADADAAPAVPRLAGAVHVIPAGPVEQKEWRELTGAEPAWTKSAKADAPSQPKPVTAGTADQVAGALQKGPAGKVERPALLVTYLPREGRVNAAFSREAKLFTERTAERRPNAVPVVIVVRPANP